jgi:hypothetical protein
MTDRHPAPTIGDPRADDPQRDPIYRWIRALMAFDMLLGAGFAVFGLATGRHAFVVVGFGLAAIGAVLFLFFTMLAKRRARIGGSPPSA